MAEMRQTDVADPVALGPREAYLKGQYAAYRALLTSPRMNKPQREVIADLALAVKDDLEAMGVTFTNGR